MDASPQTTTTPKRRVGLGRKLLLSLGSLVALALLAEGTCMLLGVEPLAATEDPFVGFAREVPLFVPRDGDPSTLETGRNKLRFFNDQSFPRSKAPGTYRIFCMGGSTTFGRPYDDPTSFCGWLRELLPAADGSRSWEVLNAGGISYASYRVSRLMEELTAYQPDLFVIYTGHNEFLEERTYGELRDMPELVRSLRATLNHTRTFTALEHIVDRIAGRDGDYGPRKDVLPAEVETRLDHSVGPSAYSRDDGQAQRILEHYRASLERMIAMARDAGAAVLLVTPASNLRDLSPFKGQVTDGLTGAALERAQRELEQGRAALETGDTTRALAALDAARGADPRNADVLYARAEALRAAGRFDQAKAEYLAARDEDVCPLRAPTAIVDTLRAVARERSVPLVDYIALLAARSEHGIPGAQFFIDHVHPTIEGNRLLGLELLRQLIELDVVHPDTGWGDARIDAVTERVTSGVDAAAHARALTTLSQVMGWAGKREEADRLAQRAVELVPNDGAAIGLAAARANRRGDEAEFTRLLARLRDLAPTDAIASHKLGQLLTEVDRYTEAIGAFEQAVSLQPDAVEMRVDLGSALIEAKRVGDARAQFERALELDPDAAEAHMGLGRILANEGDLRAAAREFQVSLSLRPDMAMAHFMLGDALMRLGERARGLDELREAARLSPKATVILDSLAWALATLPDDALRSGDESVDVAQRLQVAAGREVPRYLTTLAAALAEAGRFDEAEAATKRALAILQELGKRKRAEVVRGWLAQFEQRRPLRVEPAPAER